MATDLVEGTNGTVDGQATCAAHDSATDSQCMDKVSERSSSAAAVVVLDKLAGLDVARRAERERRREESRAAADPRESVARFLSSFAARQRNINEALQRMLQNQGQQQQYPSPSLASRPQEQSQQPTHDAANTDGTSDLVPLAVSAATPELVQSSLELISAEVLFLEQAASASSYYLPPYDQKQCAASVATLRAAIEGARTALAPRRRFAFGSKKVSKVRGEEISSAAASAHGAVSAPAVAAPLMAERDAAGAVSQSRALAAATNRDVAAAPLSSAHADDDDDATAAFLTVSGQDRALVARGRGLLGLTDATVVLTEDEVSESGAGGDFVLLGLTRCRVVLLGRLRALRIAGLRSCTVVSGPVTGACFVDDVRGSSLSLATYQVRVHRTRSTDLFLRVRSKPIIEHSTGIRVAPWAAAVAPDPRFERLLQVHMLGEETGCWQQVEDFGWIKAVQSPNWSVLPPAEYPMEPLAVPEAVWGTRPLAGAAQAQTGAQAQTQAGGAQAAGGGDAYGSAGGEGAGADASPQDGDEDEM